MAGQLPPIGFWSYARQDDEMSRGALSALRSQLKAELQQQYGREPITIFQDVGAIPPGAEWEREIGNAIDHATFLIPIITPAFVESEWCAREVELFLRREQQIWTEYPALAGKRRMFPIHYISVPEREAAADGLLKELRKLQWLDFRPLRHKSHQDEAVQLALDHLAASLCNLMRTKATPPTPEANPSGPQTLDAKEGARAIDVVADDTTDSTPQAQSKAVEGLQNQIRQMNITASYATVGRKVLGVVVALAGVWLLIHIPEALKSGPQNATGVVVACIGCFSIAGLLWK